MCRMNGNFADICAIRPISTGQSPRTSPGAFFAFLPPSRIIIAISASSGRIEPLAGAVSQFSFSCSGRKNVGICCASSGAQKLIARPLLPARAVYVRYDGRVLPDPTPVQKLTTSSSDFDIRPMCGHIGCDGTRALALANEPASDRDCAVPWSPCNDSALACRIQCITNGLTIFLVLQNHARCRVDAG